MDDQGLRNPHLLVLGCELENLYPGIRGAGGAVGFFGERDIRWSNSSENVGNLQANDPTRNMISSQVACVNFCCPWPESPGH